MPAARRVIVADDLTGANDTGVHFLSGENSVEVVVDWDVPLSLPEAGTLVVTTDSRFSAATEAAARVRDLFATLGTEDGLEIFKKVDSTLRGNVGAEIEAACEGGRYDVVCLAPATPRNGRTVVDGVCYVHGCPLEQTEIADDRFHPVRVSRVERIVAQQTSRKTGLLPLSKLRARDSVARDALESLVRDGTQVVVVDSETEEDLLRAWQLFTTLQRRVLYVGSAGLFHAMSSTWRRPVTYEPAAVPRILFVVGSLMPTSIGQLKHLEEQRGLAACSISAESVRNFPKEEVDRVTAAAVGRLQEGNVAAVHVRPPAGDMKVDPTVVGRAVGNVVKQVVEQSEVDAIVVTGGDTALQVLRALRVSRLHLKTEPLPGVPLSVIELPDGARKVIVTKAGSYGEPDVFCRVLEYLSRPKQEGASYEYQL